MLGGQAVPEAVRGCWASLWSERAVSYRSRFDIAFGVSASGFGDGKVCAVPAGTDAHH